MKLRYWQCHGISRFHEVLDITCERRYISLSGKDGVAEVSHSDALLQL